MQRQGMLSAAVVSLLLLAGCAGIGDVVSSNSASISAVAPTVDGGQPVVAVEYDLEGNGTVVLKGPDGETVAEKRLDGNSSTAEIPLEDRSGGEYRIRMVQDNETVQQENVTLSAPEPKVTDISANWSENRVQSVTLTVENGGEIPAKVTEPQLQFRERTVVGDPTTVWVEGNNSQTVTITPGYGEAAVSAAGDVRVEGSVNSSEGRLSDTVTKRFNGVNLSITNISQNWVGDTLTTVTVEVSNTGDLPATADASVYDGESELVSADQEAVDINETVSFTVGGEFNHVYERESGGTVELDVVVNSSAGFAERTISDTVAPADVTVESVDTTWTNGKLTGIEMTVRNDGGIAAEITPRVTAGETVIFDGKTTIGDIFIDDSAVISANTTRVVEMTAGSDDPYKTVTEAGEVTVSVTADGSTAEDTTAFDGPDAEVTVTGADFTESFDGETADLTSLDVTVDNTGDVPLEYADVQVELDGATSTGDITQFDPLKPGNRASHSVYFLDEITTEPGTYDIEVRLVDESGEVVASETSEVSSESL